MVSSLLSPCLGSCGPPDQAELWKRRAPRHGYERRLRAREQSELYKKRINEIIIFERLAEIFPAEHPNSVLSFQFILGYPIRVQQSQELRLLTSGRQHKQTGSSKKRVLKWTKFASRIYPRRTFYMGSFWTLLGAPKRGFQN